MSEPLVVWRIVTHDGRDDDYAVCEPSKAQHMAQMYGERAVAKPVAPREDHSFAHQDSSGTWVCEPDWSQAPPH